jgi:predicted HTH transcriptional regulator
MARDIRQLIETQGVECKKSLAERKEGLKALNAMVNADSAEGVVLFGVAPDGTAVGLDGDLDQAQRALAQEMRSKFSPAVSFEIALVPHEGEQILVLAGKRETHVPLCEYDGRAFIREGSQKRQLDLPEKLSIIRGRDRSQHPGPWRCDICGATAMQYSGGVFDGQKWTHSYECECGGEWWPDRAT